MRNRTRKDFKVVFKPGSICFFDRAKHSSHRTAPAGRFEGYGFALLLGVVPPFGRDPIEKEIIPLIGNLGFVPFDDIKEFLGEKAMEEVIQKFESKYAKDIRQPEFLDKDGNPILEGDPRLQKLKEVQAVMADKALDAASKRTKLKEIGVNEENISRMVPTDV